MVSQRDSLYISSRQDLCVFFQPPPGKRSTTPEHRAVEGCQVNRWLYIEDNRADAELVSLVLREHCPEIQLHVVNDGDEALSFLRKQGVHSDAVDPDLILMDLCIPRMDGVDLLREIRQSVGIVTTPVFSAVEDQRRVAKCYEAGATSYVVKPTDLDAIVLTLKQVANFWCHVVTTTSED